MEEEIRIYNWPDMFFVGDGEYPNLVDLSIPECDCNDFAQITKNNESRECIHLILAREYQRKFNTRPKKLGDLIV